MSYDIAVWKSVRPLNAKEAAKVYTGLDPKTPSELLVSDAALTKKLHKALLKKWPELADDNDDECPWAAALDVTDRYLVAPMSFSWAADVLPELQVLASSLGFDVFDPQKKQILKGPPPKPAADARVKVNVAEGILSRELVAPFARLGFDATKREGIPVTVFFRDLKGGVRQEITMRNRGGSDVDIVLSVRHPKVVEILTPILSEWPAPTGFRTFYRGATVASDIAYFVLDSGEKRFVKGHDICHGKCVESAIRAIPRSVKKNVLPFFDRLATIKGTDALLHRTPGEVLWRLHEDEELAFTGLTVACLAKRADFDDWQATYSKFMGARTRIDAHVKKSWAKLLKALRAL